MSQRASARQADLALLGVSILWGISFPAIKMATPFVGPALFVCLRFTAAALVLLALWPWLARGGGPAMRDEPAGSGGPRVSGEPAPAPAGSLRAALGEAGARRRGVVLGLLLALGYTTQTVGLGTTTAGNSAFVTSLSVVLTPLVAAVRWRRLPERRLAPALLLAVAGLVLLTRPDLGRLAAGDLWTLGCALAYAVYLVELSAALAVSPYLPLLYHQVITVAVATGAWAALLERRAPRWTGEVALSLALTTLLSTVLALYLQNRYQGRTTATRAALIFATEPVFATLFAALLLGELVPAGWAAGAGLILAAVLTVELAGRRAGPA